MLVRIVKLCFQEITLQFSIAPECGQFTLIVVVIKMKASIIVLLLLIGNSASSAMTSSYWTDIVALCVKYSRATHPPCNKANGAQMILNEVARSCTHDEQCLNEAVDICIKYSPSTHPPCHPGNGIRMVLDEIERDARFSP